MADYVSSFYAASNPETTAYEPAFKNYPAVFDQFANPGLPPVVNYTQRVFDTALVVWCYYTLTTITATPLTTQTTPNHTGSLLAGAHEILRIS